MPRVPKVATEAEISQNMKGDPHPGGRGHICKIMGVPSGTPIVDAKDDILIKVRMSDARKATPKDPAHCGYAIALVRSTEYENVRVYRNTTLMEGKDSKGNPVIYRYKNPAEMRAILGRFDAGKGMPSHDVTLLAPKGSALLTRERAIKRVYAAKIATGEHVPELVGRQRPDPKNLRVRLMSDRSV